MKNAVRAAACFAATVVMALIGCLFDTNAVVSTIGMTAALIFGAGFVVFANLATKVRDEYLEAAASERAERESKGRAA